MKEYCTYLSALRSRLLLLICLYSCAAFAQTGTGQRIKFTSVTSSVNTGQDYSPWLNDDVNSLVQNVWSNNFIWVDLTLKLQQHSIINSFSFYDYEGVFTTAPDSIYALNGKIKTFLGTFTGPNYMVWDALTLATPVEADAIIIRKYSNNIPQKVDIFGTPDGPAFPIVPDTVTTPPPPPPPAPTDTNTYVKIPIDSTRWFQLNNATSGLGGLFDGNLTNIVNTGWGKLINNYDAYYPVLPGEHIDLYKVKFYDYQGGIGSTTPLTLAVIDSTGKRTNIATYVGGSYQSWLGPYPGRDTKFMLDSAMKNVKYIVLNAWYGYPAEMELYGKYSGAADTSSAVRKAYPMNQYFGINAFEWDFENPTNPLVVDKSLWVNVLAFTQVRHYMDWNKLESTQGEYTFNPVHSGGWNYDAIYQFCKGHTLPVLADLKTQPNWMIASYPLLQQDAENVPVMYGKDFSDPNSYLEQAKVAFQYAARYGSNSNIKTNLMSIDTTTRWTNDPPNVIKRGMNLIKYIECDNERDKWWKGRKAYQTCYEYAANMSAFYDGNKNTMGPGVGVKNADPNMLVVMGGLASADPSYVHGMIEWCKQHRGYNADGTVNLCWDIINYHYYNNDAPPGGNATTGVAPELSGAMKTAQSFLKMSHQFANDMPVWVTESGYDINPLSIQRAPAIGAKTALQVQADWALRTSLLYARAGIQRLFFYEEYDDNTLNPTQYASSGMINANKTHRPAADYFYQVSRQFGAYTYQQTLNNYPIVDQYQSNGQKAYVVVVPDQKGITKSYTLDLGTADSAYIYTPTIGRTVMPFTKVLLTNGKLTLNVTETPVFIVPLGTVPLTAAALKINTEITDNNTFDGSVRVYPNPTSKYVTIAFNSKQTNDVIIKVMAVNTGKVYSSNTYSKAGEGFSGTVDVSNVPMGVCIVQVLQGNVQTMRKLIKTY